MPTTDLSYLYYTLTVASFRHYDWVFMGLEYVNCNIKYECHSRAKSLSIVRITTRKFVAAHGQAIKLSVVFTIIITIVTGLPTKVAFFQN